MCRFVREVTLTCFWVLNSEVQVEPLKPETTTGRLDKRKADSREFLKKMKLLVEWSEIFSKQTNNWLERT